MLHATNLILCLSFHAFSHTVFFLTFSFSHTHSFSFSHSLTHTLFPFLSLSHTHTHSLFFLPHSTNYDPHIPPGQSLQDSALTVEVAKANQNNPINSPVRPAFTPPPPLFFSLSRKVCHITKANLPPPFSLSPISPFPCLLPCLLHSLLPALSPTLFPSLCSGVCLCRWPCRRHRGWRCAGEV